MKLKANYCWGQMRKWVQMRKMVKLIIPHFPLSVPLSVPVRTRTGAISNSSFHIPHSTFHVHHSTFHIPNLLVLFACLLGTAVFAQDTFTSGLWREFVFDKPTTDPVVFEGESCAEDVKAEDYCLWLDMWYADDTPEWGVKANFTRGTHDWQKTLGAFVPEKPIKKIQFFALMRHGTGKALFRNLKLERREGAYEVLSSKVRTLMPYTTNERIILNVLAGRKRVHREIDVPTGAILDTGAVDADKWVVWTADSMRKVTPLTFPTTTECAVPKAVTVELAKRERESFQVQISCGRNQSWKKGFVKLPVLRRQDGTALKGKFMWQRVGYVMRKEGYSEHPCGVNEYETWLPDPLLPSAEFQVRAGSTQGLWFTILADADAEAGVYAGEIEILEADKVVSKVQVTAQVRAFAQPETFGMPTAFCIMDGFTRAQYGEARFAQKKRESWDIMLDHRLNPDDISRTSPPDIDDLLYARSRGMNRFNILNIVPPPTDPKTRWVCFVKPEDTFNDTFYPQFKKRLDPYVKVLREKGLMPYAYVYGFDEREHEYYEGIDRFWKQLKSDFPDLPVMTTAMMYRDKVDGKNYPALDTTDWFCPLTPVYKPELSEKLRQQGKQVWWYTCCGPHYPYANMASLEYPLIEGRLLGWMTHLYRSDGLLFWHVNYWYGNGLVDENDTYLPTWDTYSSLSMPGDGIFLYAGKEHILPSIRLAQVRDCVEDYERLQLVAKRYGAEKADAASRQLIKTMTDYTRDPQTLLQVRKQLGDLLEK